MLSGCGGGCERRDPWDWAYVGVQAAGFMRTLICGITADDQRDLEWTVHFEVEISTKTGSQ